MNDTIQKIVDQIFQEPKDKENIPSFHTGKICIEKDCIYPAVETVWGSYWCCECTIKKIREIAESLEEAIKRLTHDVAELDRLTNALRKISKGE